MAWICVDLDDTLISNLGDGQEMPIDGAVEAMMQLANQGHRLSVFTSRFAPMPDSERQRVREQIEQELAQYGFPPMEVWTGTSKPAADIFIDDKAVTFDNDWPLALAQMQFMLEERGLVPGPQPDDGSPDLEPDPGAAEPAP